MSRLTRVRARTTNDETILQSAPRLRRQVLRESLLTTVELLNRRRADRVDDDFISDYLALDWLEWNGGTLRLTITGKDVCEQLRASAA